MNDINKMPPNCINCFMFNRKINDCMICCHPPVDPYGKRPHWCPISGEIDDEKAMSILSELDERR